jgi:hypothetical protein
MVTFSHSRQYLAEFFLRWEIFQAKLVQKIKTHIFLFSNFFPRKMCRLWDNVKNVVEPDRPQMAIWRRVTCWISTATRVQAHVSACIPTPTPALARTRAHTQMYVRLIAFHGNNGFVNAPHCYVIRTLSLLLLNTKLHTAVLWMAYDPLPKQQNTFSFLFGPSMNLLSPWCKICNTPQQTGLSLISCSQTSFHPVPSNTNTITIMTVSVYEHYWQWHSVKKYFNCVGPGSKDHGASNGNVSTVTYCVWLRRQQIKDNYLTARIV